MRLISRYMLSQLISATLYTLVALLALYGFFDIIQEMPHVGQNSYDMQAMLNYVALLVPGHCYELLPLAVLIGVLVAMTQLVTHSEYTIIRTSGVTLLNIASLLFAFGLICALITLFLGEFGAPLAQQKAEQLKLSATRSLVAQEFHSGIWVKDNSNFINVREMLPDQTLLGIHVYTYDDNYHLVSTSHADRGVYDVNRKLWKLSDINETTFTPNRIVTRHLGQLDWHSVIEPSILNVLLVVPEQMSAMNLMTYIRHLRDNNQKTQRYEIAMWGKLFYPLACVSMALVALAFTPKQRRHGQLGLRLFAGICIGVAFHFTNRLFGYLGLLHDWNPALSATLPTLLFLLAGIALIAHQETR
ncbi:MAG: LPS export ABC transporter permease LptG [Paludibacterium sp.]|uniref:LPS export ABC transporter permease LptG n=1 Tax=Paludibacterium sp. TaxID=1917523 RepID=UPI0025D0E05F|nr:LPS export ABC transporter permease LptG [Paludibacterium sp.]MBV8046336.1 LPS export ABC transporter permease LptG [Paludibacterium sp.]MBV8649548.1 LPS export ABC transporter permease LptG [Paludibacterium sp.]